jgi:hypothetical protein
MTSEEMNRAFEFIIQHQAQLAIEMEDIAKLHKRLEQFTLTISELIVIESGRLDRADKQVEIQQQRLDRAEKGNRDIGAMLDIQQRRLDQAERRLDQAEQENRAAQKRHEESQQRQEQLMQELRDRLDRIFDKLS